MRRKKYEKNKNSRHLEDPKFNLVPVVIVERCNFEDLFETYLSKRNLKTSSKMRNLEYLKLPQDLDSRKLPKSNNKSIESKALNVNDKNPKNIPVHFKNTKNCIALNQEGHVGMKNDKIYPIKRKRDNVNSSTLDIDSKMQQSEHHSNKTTLKCLKNYKNKSDNLTPKSQSNDKKVLRQRRKVDYKERLSIGTPEVKQKSLHPKGTRIPIYEQMNSIQTFPKEGKHDEYDFIPESDEDKGSDFSFHIDTPAKKRKVIKRLQIHKIRSNAINTKQNNLIKPKKVNESVKYEDKVNHILKSFKEKINRRNITNIKANRQIIRTENTQAGPKNKTYLNKNNINNPITMGLIFNSTQKSETHNISLPNESLILHNKDKARGIDNAKGNLRMKQDLSTKLINSSNHNVQNILLHKESPILCNQRNLNESDINENKRASSEKNNEHLNCNNWAAKTRDVPSCHSSPRNNADDVFEDLDLGGDLLQCGYSKYIAHVSNKEDDANNLFGFHEDIEEENQKKESGTGRIKIVENLLLKKSTITNPNTLLKERPVRNSWRFNADYITRNPHFINVKTDGLPSLNQDPVLDHTFDDRIRDVNMIISVPHAEKSPIQKSILDYVESDKEHFVEKHTRPSLYNIDEYSPIKMNNADKENHNANRMQGIKRTTRRNVLGQINENIMAGKTSTPAKSKNPSVPIRIDLSLIESEEQQDVSISKNFGFHSCSDIENEIIEADKDNAGKPFRLEINVERRKKPQQLPDKLSQPVRDSDVRRLVGNDSEFLKLIEKDGLECEDFGLFEDADTSHNITKCYKPRTKKKMAGTKDNPKKKVKECKLSKEAKNWIKEFNQMCDEVDDIELEFD